MSIEVEDFLKRFGPDLSSKAVRFLVSKGINPAAARKRLSRLRGNVKRLTGIRFPNKESFLFLDEQFGTEQFYGNLISALEKTGSAYGRAIQGLVARGGAVPKAYFPIVSGLPVRNAKGQILHTIVEENLKKIKLISIVNTPDGELVNLLGSAGLTKRRRAVMVVENITLSIMRNWLIKVGWSSNKLKIRNENNIPSFGQFEWDLVGATYLAGITSYKKGGLLNGFIVADVLMGRNISEKDLRPYFSKWEALRAQRRSTRFQPMIIAESFSSEALNLLRKRGTFIAMPSIMFGEEVARDLRQLALTIENAAAAVINNPSSVFDLFDRLAKIEGVSLNSRGVLLEIIVAYLYKIDGFQIDIRQQVRGEDNVLAEIDVKAEHKEEVVLCECKAFGAPLKAAEIEDWLENALPRIKYWIRQTETLPESRRFEFYSSSGYADDAKKIIESIELEHKKQPIKFLTGQDLLARLQKKKETALVRIFREQFLGKDKRI